MRSLKNIEAVRASVLHSSQGSIEEQVSGGIAAHTAAFREEHAFDNALQRR